MDTPENFAKFTNASQSKIHPFLPKTFTVQLIDTNGDPIKTENILLHLNIYIDSGYYYTYNFIPTDSNGKVTLTKQQIIQNTELKHDYDERIPLDTTPVPFDFMVMDSNLLEGLISSMKAYLTIDLDSIKSDLKNRGFTEAQIAAQIPMIEQKMKSDRALYELLKKHQNPAFNSVEDQPKMKGSWTTEGAVSYDVILDK